eukprot:CAMPEP_0182458308 /NCGR_PEP_ID=MMETSP1319-20130603/3684_1 /TAXON_ID=172717 /ORGANISM="Bolidomonas pacifica, Strain RCC208" /LENGTH=79 /DNA_ID=CAMNT_0024656973 /DNA_START=144 /DNA_END=379 /DNA_ORIENTATION=-
MIASGMATATHPSATTPEHDGLLVRKAPEPPLGEDGVYGGEVGRGAAEDEADVAVEHFVGGEGGGRGGKDLVKGGESEE